MLIEARDLINGVSIVQAESVEQVEYFHIELETHDIIIAEGALAESYLDDDNRLMFHNANEYHVSDPAAVPTVGRYCAPRLQDGFKVEAIRRRIAMRDGLTLTETATSAGPLRGHVDRITTRLLEGWAQNVDHPEAPVCLNIYVGGRLIGQVLADRYRDDLERAGIGSGCHSFAFAAPAGVAFVTATLDVRRSLDGALLSLSVQAKLRSAA